ENALRRDLRHHEIGADEFDRDPVAAGWAADAFAAMSSLAIDEADAAARSTLDRVAAEFAHATPWLAAKEAATKAGEANVRQAVATQVARLESTLKVREADIVALQMQCGNQQEQLASLQHQYDTLVGSRPWRLASALASSYSHLPRPMKRALEWVFDWLHRS
ncbi:MAG: hypothetical protein WCJ21_13160, partial [Planctomycetota bacterium]